MRLEFLKVDEANGLLNQLIEHHPHAIFLTDHDFKVKYYNKSFSVLAESSKSDILDHEFCQIMGCTQREKLLDPHEDLCKHCQFRNLLSGSNLSDVELIRDFVINNQVKTKHLRIEAHRVVMDGHKYRLMVIDDRTAKNKID
ncbi:hypothetical protein INQ51_15800 [Maribellus sp. CM-23]|uniref:PAS domain-containing protein n=1 Tax=Maribellus sp. CM-23 TaxID=2781026 RepID=UPI001F19DAE9|nr:PAS domain-containing protein [Maribellus sp. CM-23]MCE4565785.1 hypothetical protein [Maribellus sp. CM-23]